MGFSRQNFVYLKIIEDINVEKNNFKFTKINSDEDITSKIVT